MALELKSISPIPKTAQELIDIVLNATNRKTPTVVHPGFQISRIRDFYMTKVKFAQGEFHNKLTTIIDEFPRLDAIHPFWSSLINVNYDRDHYKLALGQIMGARQLVDNIGRDYLKFLKYGDSLFRCKQLKKSALGRMATACRRLTPSLSYLEEVRQHLLRIPSIDPSRPTVILAGAPSTGKSTFMKAITNADSEVQNYPFTTKRLFLGHTDYKNITFQVIDTPGLLDRPLEERNTIEMQTIMAMVHIRGSILYFLDASEEGGYTIDDQLKLLQSLREIFATRPVIVCLSKCALAPPNTLVELGKFLEKFEVHKLSTDENIGISEAKAAACQKLLDLRLDAKKRSTKMGAIASRLHIAKPDHQWEPNIPSSVEHPQGLDHPTQRELEEEAGGAGQYVPDTDAERDLADPEWKYDVIPEIVDGRNIADYIDPEIAEKFQRLAEEEKIRLEEYQREREAFEETAWKLSDEDRQIADIIQRRKKLIRQKAQLKRSSKINVPKSQERRTKTAMASKVAEFLAERGVDEATRTKAVERVLGEKPKRVERTLEPLSRSKGENPRGTGEKFDYYVKTNYVLEPKHIFSGKSGFKRDFK